jgi:hypothetical protein
MQKNMQGKSRLVTRPANTNMDVNASSPATPIVYSGVRQASADKEKVEKKQQPVGTVKKSLYMQTKPGLPVDLFEHANRD